jgi:hypothetical protein
MEVTGLACHIVHLAINILKSISHMLPPHLSLSIQAINDRETHTYMVRIPPLYSSKVFHTLLVCSISFQGLRVSTYIKYLMSDDL